MELIRNKFEPLRHFLQSQQQKLEIYLRTFPDSQTYVAEAADQFVSNINEVIIYIASSISQSCKNNSLGNTTKDKVQYSPDQVGRVCKIKGKLQQIRYAFLCPSSERRTEITQIQHIFEEAVELCSNQLVYTNFKGATKGRNFEINEPQCSNLTKNHETTEEAKRMKQKMMEQKRILYQEVSNHLHAEQQKRRKQAKNKVISPTSNGANRHLQRKQDIFLGERQQCHPHRKKYNYLQAFQREEQCLKEQARHIDGNPSKTSNLVNYPSTQQNSKRIDKAATFRQQKQVELPNFDWTKMKVQSHQVTN